MVMSESEVKANVLQAKDQKAQIKICAELNNTCEEEIRDILKSQGVDLRTLKGTDGRKYSRKTSKPENKQASRPVVKDGAPVEIITQESPISAIRNKIDSLLKQRAGIDDELTDLKTMLTELIDSIGGNA